MTQKSWNKLTFFEQLSNIDGEVKRLVDDHEDYLRGNKQTDKYPPVFLCRKIYARNTHIRLNYSA